MAAVPDRDRLVERLSRFFEGRPEVLEAYLFGSRAHDRAQLRSDTDIAVYLDLERTPSAPFGYAAELATELISLLHDNRVDVVVLNRAGPLLYHRVLRDGVRLVSRDLAATTSREGRALSRYCDWVPHLRKLERVLADRAANEAAGR
jgi:hypothetical protein